jgi:hypothetical protein
MLTRIGTIAVLLLAVAGTSADAQGKGRGKPIADVQVSHAKVTGPGTDVEIRIIRDYYSAQSQKPKSLPPGIAKNLGRGKPLPPGIAKARVPEDLIVLLPSRADSRWIIAGDMVLLVDEGDLIVDLVRLVF